AELVARLEADWPALTATFAPGAAKVADVAVGLSDPHAGRRTVMVITFDGGAPGDAAPRKVVYKPKAVGAERAFQDLLTWLDARAVLPPLGTLRVLARDGYGWVELAARAPCA